MGEHYRRFSVYSKDPSVAFPLIQFEVKPNEIIAGIKASTFPLEEVGAVFKRASEAVQEAIKAGKLK